MRHVLRNQREVVETYREQTQYEGRDRNKALFFEGKVLYSYGYHFPLAMLLKDGHFIINGDRYSPTTSRHQWVARNNLDPHVVISGEALESVLNHIADQYGFTDFDPYLPRIGNYDIVVKAKNDALYKFKEVTKWEDAQKLLKRFRKEYSSCGYSNRITRCPTTGRRRKIWNVWGHTAETIVLGLTLEGIEFDILCSFDGSSYFCSLLPEIVETIEEAYQCLKPIEVVKAPPNAEIYRQGEWFFIYQFPTSECSKRLGVPLKYITQKPLPYLQGGNRHHTRYVIVRGNPYCLGGVYHRNMWGRGTREHKALFLPHYKIFKAVRNRELFSSTATTPVD